MLLLIGQSTGGVALFASGIIIANHPIRFTPAVLVNVGIKNLLQPAFAWLVVLLLGLAVKDAQNAIIALAIPAPPLILILAQGYKQGVQEMASTLALSTILSAFTLSLFIYLVSLY